MRRKLSLREIQQIEFDILVEFDRICTENEIRYSLDSGTLLGAIRHGDFIPWDDDIDVIMLRSDYMKLCNLLPSEFREIYKLEKINYRPFAKICDLRTMVLNQSKSLYENDEQLWIDIFPVDGVSDSKTRNFILNNKIKFMRRMQIWSNTIHGTGSTPIRAIAKLPFVAISKLRKPAYYSNKIEEILMRVDDRECEYVSPIIFWDESPIIPRSAFDNLIKVPFHGREFWAIPCWDEYLTALYGDYMQLPPESERHVHLADAWLIE